ncbi:MAG TPA: aminomethyl-transferring glycine dehydrogenase subunit GcvPB, partial [Candidatus Thermoplasmatota archaeon]|nr:aminomethyl-transferring glycine dehydrogenase subunit GcvPB [Candidatus Thermoplasmatota archaeon]
AGLRGVSEHAVLNANYLLSRVKPFCEVPHGDRCMHEFVASARGLRRERRISAMDIAKRLLDYGYHAPTVYFPLIVDEAIMIEPTETESKRTLDRFCDAIAHIVNDEDPEVVKTAPHNTSIARVDEVKAVKEPRLTYDMKPRGGGLGAPL